MKKLDKRVRCGARVGAVVSAVVLSSCLCSGMAFADSVMDSDDTLIDIALPELMTPGLHTDYVASDSEASLSSSDDVRLFDLRQYGAKYHYDSDKKMNVFNKSDDGINYVTPVKLQNPFGSCWAFSCTAASETSMLTTLDTNDDGEMNGSTDYENAANGEAGNKAKKASDLSERHLAYFVYAHPSLNGLFSSEAGEGSYLTNGTDDAASKMNTGGMLFLGMSAYSTGIGPVDEATAPYTNDEGWIQVPTTHAPVNGDFVYAYFLNKQDALDYMAATWNKDVIAEFNTNYGTALTMKSVVPRIAKIGTWAVDNDQTYKVVAELKNSNIIADTKTADGCLTTDEIEGVKDELRAGRAVSIAFAADQSRPNQVGANNYLNTETWAQYTYNSAQVNHAVTIVGYDDDYDASNFTHKVYKQNAEGKWVVDEENSAKTTPAGNGAWIVKNSWGSTDYDEDDLQYNDWGIDGSGYFYLSYYDKSICKMESYEYDLSDEAQERTGYVSYQYDLAPVSSQQANSSTSKYEMVNVFDGPDTNESTVMIRDLGCLTGAPNVEATLEVYVMDDSIKDVTAYIDNNEATYKQAETFEEAGFHRLNLKDGVIVEPGQKFAVVQTNYRKNEEKYEYTFGYGTNKTMADAYNEAMSPVQSNALSSYCATVVNKGASLLKTGDTWQDWTEVIPELDADATTENIKEVRQQAEKLQKMAEIYKLIGQTDVAAKFEQAAANCASFTCTSSLAADNFTIKAYADEVADCTVTFDCNGQDASYTESQTLYRGTKATQPNDPEAVGCTFKGWYLDKECTQAFDFSEKVTDSITLYAKWEVNANPSAFARLAGENAYGTMEAVVKAGWNSADTVILASFDGYWDALSASSLAGKYNAPILFTGSDSLSTETAQTIESLGAKHVIVIGGTAAISDSVLVACEQLSTTPATSRVSGDVASATALEVADSLGSTMGKTAFICTVNGYWDALSAAAPSYANQLPILLASASVADENGSALDDATLSWITSQYKSGAIESVIIVGGTEAVSSQTLEQLASACSGLSVQRIAGNNAVETSNEFASWSVTNLSSNADGLGIATVSDFHDALAGAALCGKNNSVVLLADSSNPKAAAWNFVFKYRADIYKAYVFGGTAAVSNDVVKALEEVIPPAK